MLTKQAELQYCEMKSLGAVAPQKIIISVQPDSPSLV